MKLADRVTQLNDPDAPGWDLFYRARAMIDAGADVTELTIGEHDTRTDPKILDAMDRAARGGNTGYAPVPGSRALRAAIAERVTAKTGVPTGPDNVTVTAGGQAALFATHMAVCDPGDIALYCDPYYATYPVTINATGARGRAVPTRAKDAFAPRASDILARADGAVSLLINSPNNPTGAVYSRAVLEDISAACRDADLWLISDEVYDGQVWEGAHISPRTLPGMAERTVVIGSMSKTHGMTGSRLGWAVGPEEVIAHMIELAHGTTYGVPGFIQDAALAALRLGPAFEAEIAAPFRRRRTAALALLDGHNVVRTVGSQGAMYMMLDIRATGLSGIEFADDLLDRRGIAVMPGESFGQAAAGHVRAAMTVNDAAWEAALRDLIAHAEELCHA